MDVSGNLLVLCLSESQFQSLMDSESRRRRACSSFDKSRQDIIEALGLFSLHDFLQPFPNNFANRNRLRRRHFNYPLIGYNIQNISVGRTSRTLGIFDSSQPVSISRFLLSFLKYVRLGKHGDYRISDATSVKQD